MTTLLAPPRSVERRLAHPPYRPTPVTGVGRPFRRVVRGRAAVRSSRARATWNTVTTAVLLATLGGVLVLVGSLFGEFGALVGLLVGLAVVGTSYWCSDRLALRAAGAVPVQPWELPEYHRIVRELCRDAGLPMPRLDVTPDAQPNAFATGRNPRHAAVAVTRGLLELLEPRELRAVLAHELGHVGNRDILLTSVAAAVATGITLLANLAGWLPLFGSSDDEDAPNPLGLLVAVLLAPIAATLLQLALSRSRELDADRTGAALIGDGTVLAGALAKIEAVARRTPMHVEPAQAGKYLVNPLTGRVIALGTMFSAHPPTAERVARLRGMRSSVGSRETRWPRGQQTSAPFGASSATTSSERRRTMLMRGSSSPDVRLPAPVDSDAGSASLGHGVLTMVVTEAEQQRRRRIPIGSRH